ncbi:Hypothetical predicted protein [Pelobates cultripes]|uniref:Uncharacterized protein n=1 Tax=Pelobates cultripes TaxID=61616 RepID=A0AAD1VV27_PELCU|nr:Hypothetical predicted protein [Pelobates cultripes]
MCTKDTKPKVVFKKNQTIQNIVAPTLPYRNQECSNTPFRSIPLKGTYKCGRKNCVTCSFIEPRSNHFSSNHNNQDKQYEINGFINCNTSYVVYLTECPMADNMWAEHAEN